MRTAKTLSDWADAQAVLNLRWAHRSFYWFCRAAAQVRSCFRCYKSLVADWLYFTANCCACAVIDVSMRVSLVVGLLV